MFCSVFITSGVVIVETVDIYLYNVIVIKKWDTYN